jgi:hypothetical protein
MVNAVPNNPRRQASDELFTNNLLEKFSIKIFTGIGIDISLICREDFLRFL